MVEVRCTICGALQKADENKYEVVCKKCKKTFNLEEGLDCVASMEGIQVEDADFDTLLMRAEDCLAEKNFGGAKAFAEKALEKNGDEPHALWAMCRAVMCAPNLAPDAEADRYLAGDRSVLAEIATRDGMTKEKAEAELRMRLRKDACFADEESDGYFGAAVETAGEEFKAKIERTYARYGFSADGEAKREHLDPMNAVYNDVKPNFSPKQKAVIGWKLILATVLSFLAIAGSIILMSLDFINGWTIALLVVVFFVSVVCCLILAVDSTRILIKKAITVYCYTDIADVAAATMHFKTPAEQKGAEERCSLLVGSMIFAGQLTYIGLREGKTVDYYDDNCVRIEAGRERTENRERE